MSGAVVEVKTNSEFDQLLSETPYVVTDFYADWCGPCKVIAPLYKELASQRSVPKKVVFAKVNVDDLPEVAGRFGVSAMPTFKLFKEGEEAESIRGANPAALKAVVNSIPAAPEPAKSSAAGGDDDAAAVSGNYTMPSGTRADWKMSLEG